MSTQYSPPEKDQIEISVFGPGYGESILIHFGNGNWIIVDSCADRDTKKSVPLDYIKKLGFDPGTAIKYVIASHWHDDHVKGLHEVVEAATSTLFSCASVLTGKEFMTLGEMLTEEKELKGSGPIELYRCIQTITQREDERETQLLVWSSADRILLLSAKHNLKLTALSPSDKMHTRSLDFMARYVHAYRKKLTEPNLQTTLPNDVAVALLLEINGRNIILGSDLEESKDPLCGWTAVVNGITLPNAAKSVTYKVSHHGSETGHHQSIWDNSLVSHPYAFLTPFKHGRHRIPDKDERARILALTDNAFITACPESKTKAPKKTKKVQDLVAPTLQNHRLSFPEVGHIRWRASITNLDDAGNIELFNGAKPLSEIGK